MATEVSSRCLKKKTILKTHLEQKQHSFGYLFISGFFFFISNAWNSMSWDEFTRATKILFLKNLRKMVAMKKTRPHL